MTLVTVWATHDRWGMSQPVARVVAGVLFVVGALAFVRVLADVPGGAAVPRPAACVLGVVTGLAIVLVSPAGLGEVPLFMAASRLPHSFSGRTAHGMIVATTIATGAAVAYASHSLAGLIAGVGVPFLAQRAVDRQELVEQRDRAEAMVVEVEAGRDAEAQAAALRERAHIAREMHDVLAHSLAGLSLQLQAARAIAQQTATDPRLEAALESAAALARDGLAEARSAVGTLAAPAQRGVGDLGDLVATHPPRARLTASGEPAALSAEAGHAVYRAVQESLTNAARYAPGSPVEVTLAWTPGGLQVEVLDRGAAPGHAPLTGQGGGLGLPGMRERIEAVGGRTEAAPSGPGWRVRIMVPTGGAA